MVFLCEYPDHKNDQDIRSLAFGGFEELDMRILQCYGFFADAPRCLQLNWNNVVLWRMMLHYPQGDADLGL